MVLQRERWTEASEHLLVSGHQGASKGGVAQTAGVQQCSAVQCSQLACLLLKLPIGWCPPTKPQHTSPTCAGCVVSIGFNPRLFHLPKAGGQAGEVEERLSSVFALGSQDKRVSGALRGLQRGQRGPAGQGSLGCRCWAGLRLLPQRWHRRHHTPCPPPRAC